MIRLFLALLLLALPSAAQVDTESVQINVTVQPLRGVEQRCTALGMATNPPLDQGEVCLCSEPMQTERVKIRPGADPSMKGTPACIDGSVIDLGTYPNQLPCENAVYDFEDSPDGSECKYEGRSYGGMKDWNFAHVLRDGFVLRTAQQEPLPPGNTVVLALGSKGNYQRLVEHAVAAYFGSAGVGGAEVPTGPGGLTLCSRYYERWAADSPMCPWPNQASDPTHVCYMPPGEISGYKSQTIQGGSGGWAIQTTETGSSIWSARREPWGSTSSPLSPQVRINDCVNNYCRVETCLDYKQSTLTGRTRHRVTVLPSQFGGASTNQGPHTHDFGWALVPDPLRWWATAVVHYWTGAGAVPSTPTRFGVYAMVAQTNPADSNWWIGPACEVEGGCP